MKKDLVEVARYIKEEGLEASEPFVDLLLENGYDNCVAWHLRHSACSLLLCVLVDYCLSEDDESLKAEEVKSGELIKTFLSDSNDSN